MTNHYETLGIKPTATQEEINKAYHKLSEKFHPDNNDGDEYFIEMFRNIQEAYEDLINENEKATNDCKKNINMVATAKNDTNDFSPKILYFESDKDSFLEGDTIELKWKTTNADKIIVKPFGELEISGTRLFKLKNFNKPELEITLKATNSLSEESLIKTIKLKNKVIEVDFSEFEENNQNLSYSDNPDNPDLLRTEPVSESVTPNSIVQTASQPETTEKFEPKRTQGQESFFSIKGRLRRSTYLIRAILLAIPLGLAYIIMEGSYDDGVIFFNALIVLSVSFILWMQFVKRLHDINLSGWWSLLNIIPLVGSIFGLVVIFIDSSKGRNKYGTDPKNR